MRTLSHAEAKAFYDRFGSKQDLQAFEDAALEELIRHGGFAQADTVLECGCGTGRLGARLLCRHLPAHARYLGLDVSETMVRLARQRLKPWAGRAEVRRTEGEMQLPVAAASQDIFLCTYVLDLLSEADIRALLAEARRVLKPNGRLCLASLSYGRGVCGRIVAWLWQLVYTLRPQWLGGCRPIRLLAHLPMQAWHIEHHRTISRFGIASEVVIASKV